MGLPGIAPCLTHPKGKATRLPTATIYFFRKINFINVLNDAEN